MQQIISLKQLSDILGISDSEIRKLIRENRIPYFKIGYRYMFKVDSINKWIDRKENKNYILDCCFGF